MSTLRTRGQRVSGKNIVAFARRYYFRRFQGVDTSSRRGFLEKDENLELRGGEVRKHLQLFFVQDSLWTMLSTGCALWLKVDDAAKTYPPPPDRKEDYLVVSQALHALRRV